MKFCGLFLALMLFLGCSTTQCTDHSIVNKAPAGNIEKTVSGVDQMNKVKIYKADGTLQCNQGEKISLEKMAKELGVIHIFSSENKHDGLMRIQLCGKPTGNNNVYEIESVDLEKALALGFKKWAR